MPRVQVHRALSPPSDGPTRGVRVGPSVRTRRRRAPQAIIAGAAALRAAAEDSDEGVILTDGQGIILYANPASERFLGLPPLELCGRLGFDFCHPHSLPAARDAFGYCVSHPGTPVDVTVDVARALVGFRTLAVTLVNRLSVPDVNAVVVHFCDAAPPGWTHRACAD